MLLKALYLEQINKLDKKIVDDLNILMTTIQYLSIQHEIKDFSIEIIGYFALVERLTKDFKESYIINNHSPTTINYWEILFKNLSIENNLKVTNEGLKVFVNKKDIMKTEKELSKPENMLVGFIIEVCSFPEEYESIDKCIEKLKQLKKNYCNLHEMEQGDIDFLMTQLIEKIEG